MTQLRHLSNESKRNIVHSTPSSRPIALAPDQMCMRQPTDAISLLAGVSMLAGVKHLIAPSVHALSHRLHPRSPSGLRSLPGARETPTHAAHRRQRETVEGMHWLVARTHLGLGGCNEDELRVSRLNTSTQSYVGYPLESVGLKSAVGPFATPLV